VAATAWQLLHVSSDGSLYELWIRIGCHAADRRRVQRVYIAYLIVDSTEQRHQSRLNVDYVAAAAAGCMRRTSFSAASEAAWQRDKTLVDDAFPGVCLHRAACLHKRDGFIQTPQVWGK